MRADSLNLRGNRSLAHHIVAVCADQRLQRPCSRPALFSVQKVREADQSPARQTGRQMALRAGQRAQVFQEGMQPHTQMRAGGGRLAIQRGLLLANYSALCLQGGLHFAVHAPHPCKPPAPIHTPNLNCCRPLWSVHWTDQPLHGALPAGTRLKALVA